MRFSLERKYIGLLDRGTGWETAIARRGWRGLHIERPFQSGGRDWRRRDTAIIFLSRRRYGLLHATYPPRLKDDLQRVVELTRQELLPNGGDTPYFLGAPCSNGDSVHVPVFFLPQGEDPFGDLDLLGKVARYVATPAALYYDALLPEGREAVVAVPMGDGRWEVAVFTAGALMDCFLVAEDTMATFKAYLDRLPGHRRWSLGEGLEDMGFAPLRAPMPLTAVLLEAALSRGKIEGWPTPLAVKMSPVWLAYACMLVAMGLYCAWCVDLRRDLTELRARDRGLKAEIARLQSELKPVEKLKGDVERLRALLARVQKARQERVSPLKVLELLTEITPRDIWLDRFELKGREVVIDGYAVSADSYVALLSSAPELKDVRFASSVRKDKSGKEKFSIKMVIK